MKFEKKKAKVKKQVEQLMSSFESLSEEVSPRYWRKTGNIFMDLKKMKEDLGELTEASPEELRMAHELGLLTHKEIHESKIS